MGIHVDRDLAGSAHDFAVGVDPERCGASDRKALSLIRKQSFEPEMISAVGCREDPEEIHAVKIACSKKVEDSVTVYGIGAEFETSALVTGVHDNSEESARPEDLFAVAGNLHSDHGAGEDHMDRFRNIDQFTHADTVEDSL